jgi:thioredoxin 1
MAKPERSFGLMDVDALVSRSAQPVLIGCYSASNDSTFELANALAQLSIDLEDHLTVEKIDVAQFPDVASEFSVSRVPTLLLFKGGRLKSSRAGNASISQIVSWLFEQGAVK